MGSLLCILPLLPVFFLSEVVDCDYSVFGVILICLIYLARDRKWQIGVLAPDPGGHADAEESRCRQLERPGLPPEGFPDVDAGHGEKSTAGSCG